MGEVVVALFGECGRGLTFGLGGGGFMSIARSVAARLSITNEGDIGLGSEIRKRTNERTCSPGEHTAIIPVWVTFRRAYFSLEEPLVAETTATI